MHTFSLVHDDLPALDDDDERRGRPSAHVAFGEGVALLAGDALLAEAFRLALAYPTPAVARELAEATLGMIGGQYRDITGDDADLAAAAPAQDGAALRRRGRAAGSGRPACRRRSRRRGGRSARSSGLLFQVVDDVLDGDGYAARLGDEARALADDGGGAGARALAAIPADTSVLAELVDVLAVDGADRTRPSCRDGASAPAPSDPASNPPEVVDRGSSVAAARAWSAIRDGSSSSARRSDDAAARRGRASKNACGVAAARVGDHGAFAAGATASDRAR